MSNDAHLGDRYIAVQESEEFGRLRRTFRRFVFPVTALFLAWYFLYVVLSMFAPDFMGIKLWGSINVGLVLGLGQFVSTFAITIVDVRAMASRELLALVDGSYASAVAKLPRSKRPAPTPP